MGNVVHAKVKPDNYIFLYERLAVNEVAKVYRRASNVLRLVWVRGALLSVVLARDEQAMLCLVRGVD
jgi:hypothetical protein